MVCVKLVLDLLAYAKNVFLPFGYHFVNNAPSGFVVTVFEGVKEIILIMYSDNMLFAVTN